MKRLTVLLIACALATSCLAQESPPATSAPGRTPGPYDSLASSASAPPSASSTLTPAGAMVMQACAKTVIAEAVGNGETTVQMRHIAQIDRCAALARATLLAR
jgi:hypothetical protein